MERRPLRNRRGALACCLVVLAIAFTPAARTAATDEFPAGQLSIGKLRFGQQGKPGRDSIVLPGSSLNFFALTPAQSSAANGGKVTLRLDDYCRTFGPLALGGGSRRQLKATLTDPATGEKFKASFAETAIPDHFKASLSVKNTEHAFPAGSFPRRSPKDGDPPSLVATLVVGGVGGTFDVLSGARLPFVDPGLQAASEELPDRRSLDLQDVWTFVGHAGERVSFRVDTAGGAPSGLDLAAELVAPDGQTILAKADDEFACTVPTACGWGCPEVSGFELPQDGTYSIVVHDFGDRDDACSSGGTYALSISEPACTGATLAYDRDRAVCGDGIIGPGEACEQAADCGAGESCSATCQCEPLCGNGTIDPGEQCEQDSQCASGEICDGCACVVALGNRTMTINPSCSFLDTSLSPVRKPGTATGGTITLRGGALDANGVAPVTVSDTTFLPINISLVSQTLCVRLGPCAGQIACNGGVNVDVLAELDSLKSGLTCAVNGASCTNACEGFNKPHSGNATEFSSEPAALPASPAGSMSLTCDLTVATLSGVNGNCSSATYPAGGQVTFTTGASLARVVHHCAGSGASAATVPEFGGTGIPFSCAAWTTTDGPGTLVLAVPAEEPNSTFSGDGANLFAFCD